MNIKIVKDKISKKELEEIAREFYFPMVKGVVDIESGIVTFGGEYHNDANVLLQNEEGLEQENIWGFNLYLDRDDDSIEHISLINIRPMQGNMSMEVEDEKLKNKMTEIIKSKIYE